MNKTEELEAMYTVVRKGCAGFICTNCPTSDHEYCGDALKIHHLYEEGWHRQTEAEWVWKTKIEPQAQSRLYCSACDSEALSKGMFYVYSNYCPNCGAKMIGVKK